MFRAMDAGQTFGDGQIDPRFFVGSPAQGAGVALPNDGFFEQVSYLGAFGEDLWLQGLSILEEQGRLTDIVAVDDTPSMLAEDFQLDAYPNPFNPESRIRFALPSQQKVMISVYNLMGQEVSRLVDREMSAGYHSVTLDGSQMTTGIYFIRMETAQKVLTQKLTLLK